MPAESADEPRRAPAGRGWGLLLVIGSAIGFLAAMILTIDRIRLLTDPQVALVCDISPFVTCGPVMSSAAGALFGFPNPLLGIAGFAIAGTTGMVLLAGARLARWYLVASKSAAWPPRSSSPGCRPRACTSSARCASGACACGR